MANQCQMVLMHMKKYGSITHLEAEQEYGIARLASRIKDLRNMGYTIETELISSKNRRGEPSHFARYRLEEDNNA